MVLDRSQATRDTYATFGPSRGIDGTGPTRTTVICVAPDRLTGEGLASLLATAADLDVIAIETSADDAAEVAKRVRPHVAIIDELVRNGGPECVRRLRRDDARLGAILVSSSSSNDALPEALAAGCSGFLSKQLPSAILEATVRSVGASRTAIHALRTKPRTRLEAAGAGLSRRELDILQMLVYGLSVGAIADHLEVSALTVHTSVEEALTTLCKQSLLGPVALSLCDRPLCDRPLYDRRADAR